MPTDAMSVKEMIDELYWKEKKYVKYLRDDYVGQNDFIFNLNKTHQLKLSKIESTTATSDTSNDISLNV